MNLSEKIVLNSQAKDILSSLIHSTKESKDEMIANITEINTVESSMLLDNFLRNENKFGFSEKLDNKANDVSLDNKTLIKFKF